ncbi:MAG: methyltransferase type 12 [Pedosphaera sp.]|nr:methyltransferase type 12 [Pedosphaera sp.]
MFLNRRVLQAEYFDEPDRPQAELAEAYQTLARFNRLFSLGRSFKQILPKTLGAERCRSLSLLDLGAGDGSLGNDLACWAAEKGWNWQITNLDLNLRALQLNRAHTAVAGSALALPFRDHSFDVVVASQMTHHFMTDSEVCLHFKEAWRVTRNLLVITDVHRNFAFYLALVLVLRFYGVPRHFLSDALLSVRRGWRVPEWKSLAAQAGILDPKIWLYAGTRMMLEARRQI